MCCHPGLRDEEGDGREGPEAARRALCACPHTRYIYSSSIKTRFPSVRDKTQGNDHTKGDF